MAVAIPIISAFATIAEAGSIAAAVGTVGGFLSVAGGVLAGVGILTDNKDLSRLGGLLTLGSGVANIAGAGGAAAGADAAAEEGAKTAFRTSELTDAASAPSLSAGANGSWDVLPSGDAPSLAQTAAQRAAPAPVAPDTPVAQSAQPLGQSLQAPAAPAATEAPAATAAPSAPLAGPATGANAGPLGQPSNPIGSEYPNPVQPNQIANAGANMTQGDLQKYLDAAWNRTQGLLKNTSSFLRDNKELVSIVGNAFSPQAEQLDWQKSIYNRRRAALNSPVALGPRTGG